MSVSEFIVFADRLLGQKMELLLKHFHMCSAIFFT